MSWFVRTSTVTKENHACSSPGPACRLADIICAFHSSASHRVRIYTRVLARPNLAVPPPGSLLPTTCARFPLAPSSFFYPFLLSSRPPTSPTAWISSGMATLMQWAALIPMVIQQPPQQRLDSPTEPARPTVERAPRVSIGGSSRSCLPRGFSPGWLSSASFPLVPGTMQMTLPQVSISPLSPALLLIRMYLHKISCPKRGVPCSGCLLPPPHLPKRPSGLSQGATDQARQQE